MAGEILKLKAQEMKKDKEKFINIQKEIKFKMKDKSSFIKTKKHIQSIFNFKLFKDKKGSVAFEWIYALIFLFGLSIVYIVFNQVITNEIYPITDLLVPDTFANKGAIEESNDRWMTFWNAIPFVILIVVIMFLLIRSLIANTKNY